jgi:hypothetical protein
MPRLPLQIYFGVQLPGQMVSESCSSLTCPSCHNKKVVKFGHHLKETLLYPVHRRQYVFSIPIILRKFFLYERKLLGKLSGVNWLNMAWSWWKISGKANGSGKNNGKNG